MEKKRSNEMGKVETKTEGWTVRDAKYLDASFRLGFSDRQLVLWWCVANVHQPWHCLQANAAMAMLLWQSSIPRSISCL